MLVFKPKRSSWLPLMVIALFPIGIGFAAVVQDPSSWLLAICSMAFGVALVGYNATVRLILSGEELALKRYGRMVWRAPIERTCMREGLAGQPALIPGYLFYADDRLVGFILKSWFADDVIGKIKSALRNA